MTFIDTHCHLYDEAFDSDREEALQRALQSGVSIMLMPDIDSSTTPRLEATLCAHADHLYAMTGLHPTSVNNDFEHELAHVHHKLSDPGNSIKYVAVGEIGMDLYWDTTYLEQQRQALRQQMLWAEEYNLPVCLHIRKAHNEVFGLLRDLNRRSYRGVMHCFGGSMQEAHRAIEMGFYLGVGGVVTFKNSTLAEIAKTVPLDHILLETDAPYLSPVPHRGQRNESAHIPLIASRIAELRGISIDEVAQQTSQNARTLFALESLD